MNSRTRVIPTLRVAVKDDGSVTAEGRLHGDRDYYAMGRTIDDLRARILADARADGWPAWALHIPRTEETADGRTHRRRR